MHSSAQQHRFSPRHLSEGYLLNADSRICLSKIKTECRTCASKETFTGDGSKNQAKAEVGQKICIKILNIFNLSSQSL